MSISKDVLWVEKYRPDNINDYVFNNPAHRTSFNQMIEQKAIPHLLLSGVQGTGKTTLAQILVKALEVDGTDILVINGSDETGVDAMRDKIKGFISTIALSGVKIVRIEEADYLSLNAQAVLRNYMEEYSEQSRFILTCNYENKIIPALKSRVQHFTFKAADDNEIAEFCAKVLITEGVTFDIELLDKYIVVGNPDIRKIINMLQQNTINLVLQPILDNAGNDDYKFVLLDHITTDNWNAARHVVCNNVGSEEWEDVYSFLYKNLHTSSKFSDVSKWESGIVVVAEHLYKHSLVADPEINAAAMFIRLSQI